MKNNKRIDIWKEFTRDSKFTEEDALELGAEVSRNVMKRHKEIMQ